MSGAAIGVLVVGIVVVLVVSAIQMRRGGPGPAMRWIPRSWRPRANEVYESRGWQRPFDDDGRPT